MNIILARRAMEAAYGEGFDVDTIKDLNPLQAHDYGVMVGMWSIYLNMHPNADREEAVRFLQQAYIEQRKT